MPDKFDIDKYAKEVLNGNYSFDSVFHGYLTSEDKANIETLCMSFISCHYFKKYIYVIASRLKNITFTDKIFKRVEEYFSLKEKIINELIKEEDLNKRYDIYMNHLDKFLFMFNDLQFILTEYMIIDDQDTDEIEEAYNIFLDDQHELLKNNEDGLFLDYKIGDYEKNKKLVRFSFVREFLKSPNTVQLELRNFICDYTQRRNITVK